MTLLSYVLTSYEYHFPEYSEYCRYRDRKPAFVWRIVHVLYSLGILRLHEEGGFYRDAEWRWKFWEPIYLHGNYWAKGLSTFCPVCGENSVKWPSPFRDRIQSAWYSLRGMAYLG